MMFFGCNVLSVNPLKCVSMNNQECKVKPETININSNEPFLYPYSIEISKYSGTCNNINDLYAKLCVPDVVKNINVKVFNLMSRTNETRHIKWCESFKCTCSLDASVCNNKQSWNNEKCRCEGKELIDKRINNKGFVKNPSNCDCECDKSCDIREYLDYKNCKFRKKLVDKLVEECSENIDRNEIIHNDYGNVCSSCIIYIVLIVIAFLIIIGISSGFIYFHRYLKKNNAITTNINPGTKTVIY